MLRQLIEAPEGECAGHYVERIEGLYAHARETRSTHVLVDVIAWSLARLEAEQAKASGQRPH